MEENTKSFKNKTEKKMKNELMAEAHLLKICSSAAPKEDALTMQVIAENIILTTRTIDYDKIKDTKKREKALSLLSQFNKLLDDFEEEL